MTYDRSKLTQLKPRRNLTQLPLVLNPPKSLNPNTVISWIDPSFGVRRKQLVPKLLIRKIVLPEQTAQVETGLSFFASPNTADS